MYFFIAFSLKISYNNLSFSGKPRKTLLSQQGAYHPYFARARNCVERETIPTTVNKPLGAPCFARALRAPKEYHA